MHQIKKYSFVLFFIFGAFNSCAQTNINGTFSRSDTITDEYSKINYSLQTTLIIRNDSLWLKEKYTELTKLKSKSKFNLYVGTVTTYKDFYHSDLNIIKCDTCHQYRKKQTKFTFSTTVSNSDKWDTLITKTDTLYRQPAKTQIFNDDTDYLLEIIFTKTPDNDILVGEKLYKRKK